MTTRITGFFFAVALICKPVDADDKQAVAVSALGSKYELIGKLHRPLGIYITVQGVVTSGPTKGYESGPNLRAQRIQGSATQEDIQIAIYSYWNKWGEEAVAGGIALPKLEWKKTYEMEGYETGGYVGVPSEAYEKGEIEIQTTGHYFKTYFKVVKAKEIEPIKFTPRDFEGAKALLQGTARTEDNKSLVQGDGWTVTVDATAGWPGHVEGKLVESYGFYNPAPDRKHFALIDGAWRLVRLDDQLNRSV